MKVMPLAVAGSGWHGHTFAHFGMRRGYRTSPSSSSSSERGGPRRRSASRAGSDRMVVGEMPVPRGRTREDSEYWVSRTAAVASSPQASRRGKPSRRWASPFRAAQRRRRACSGRVGFARQRAEPSSWWVVSPTRRNEVCEGTLEVAPSRSAHRSSGCRASLRAHTVTSARSSRRRTCEGTVATVAPSVSVRALVCRADRRLVGVEAAAVGQLLFDTSPLPTSRISAGMSRAPIHALGFPAGRQPERRMSGRRIYCKPGNNPPPGGRALMKPIVAGRAKRDARNAPVVQSQPGTGIDE
jgi:hypothetical protein